MAYSGKTITLSWIGTNNQVPIEGKAQGFGRLVAITEHFSENENNGIG